MGAATTAAPYGFWATNPTKKLVHWVYLLGQPLSRNRVFQNFSGEPPPPPPPLRFFRISGFFRLSAFLRLFRVSAGQINFDGKLLSDLKGFGKVNRLAVVLVQEAENNDL